MIISKKRRGRPKSAVQGQAKTSTERTRAYRERLKNAGGGTITLSLEESELALLKSLREKWNLSENVTNSEIIRAMIVVLDGHTFISSGCDIEAKVIITKR